MDRHDVDLLDQLRAADPAENFRADSHWIAHRLSELLEDDPAFQAPQLQDTQTASAVSRRPKLVWLSSAAAVLLLVGGGFFAGNFFATNSVGESGAMAPYVAEGRERIEEGAPEDSVYQPNSSADRDSTELMYGTESASTLNDLAAAPLEEQLSWLAGRLDPGLIGTFEFERSTGSVTFQAELAVTHSDPIIQETADTAYESSILLIAELAAVFAPHEEYQVTYSSFGDGLPLRTTVEFLGGESGQIDRAWVLEHDGLAPVSFRGTLVD